MIQKCFICLLAVVWILNLVTNSACDGAAMEGQTIRQYCMHVYDGRVLFFFFGPELQKLNLMETKEKADM